MFIALNIIVEITAIVKVILAEKAPAGVEKSRRRPAFFGEMFFAGQPVFSTSVS